MQFKVFNAYRITHENGSVEDINALDLVQALDIHNLEYSPIKGPEGNIEYLVYIEKDENPKKEESVDLYAVVEAAHGSLDK